MLNINRSLKLLAKLWSIFIVFILIYTDLVMQRLIVISDYVMTFFVAGKLALFNKFAALYPPSNAVSFTNTPFDKAAHALLPVLPTTSTAAYMYLPLNALLFVPLTFLPYYYSLLIFQLLCLVALWSCFFIWRSSSGFKPIDWFFGSLSFTPVVMTIWIGQLGILFGLMPLGIGYWLLVRGKFFAAGAVWALLLLKPQLFLAVALMSCFWVARGRWQVLIGLFSASLLILLINIKCCGLDAFNAWLGSISVSERCFSNPTSAGLGVASHLVTSLPNALLLTIPQIPLLKPVVYTISGFLGLAGIISCLRLTRSNVPFMPCCSIMMILCLVMLPLVAPHFFIYDLSVLVFAAILVAVTDWPVNWPITELRQLVILGWASTNIYTVMHLLNVPVHPLLLIGVFLIIYVRLLWQVNQLVKYQPNTGSS